MWQDFLSFAGTVKSFVMSFEVASTVGAVLSLRWAPGNTWGQRAFSLVGGLGMAFYVGPFVMERLEVKSNNGLMAAGFMFGLLGANLLSKIFNAVRQIDVRGHIEDFLQRMKGK